ncbi:MAG: thioredoxin family protein [Bacteroidales bacterium]|nr:thioredoxin family protein [Bacteroidales bacterium]
MRQNPFFKKLAKLFFALIFFACTTAVYAQSFDQPVSWSSQVEKIGENLYEMQFHGAIEGKWHIYDLGPYEGGPNPTVLKIEEVAGIKLVGTPYIKSDVHKAFDEMFNMEIGTCENGVVLAQKVEVSSASPITLTANIEWQACDNGSCLPPADEDVQVKLPAAAGVAVTEPAEKEEAAPAESTQPAAVAEEVATEVAPAAEEEGKSLWGVILEAIAWGFVALLTPCVFPMVPMTVSFFLKNSGGKAKGRFMASLYGFSIVALYTLPIAIIIFITYFVGGDAVTADIFNWLATHWIPNLIFFAIFMVFAASFFGAFEITMPSWMVNKADSKSDKGGIIGVFFMALTLVLVSFSCTGPIVGSILIKSTQGEIWEPIITMLAFSIAFALPFTVFAFAPSLLKDLPKSGGWLNSVKVVLGFLELALGLKFLSVADQTYHWGILDREVYLALWIVIFSLLGLYLLGKLRFAHDTPQEHLSVKRLILSIIVFAFVVYMIPGMWGAPLKALSGYMPPIATQDFVLGSGGTVNNAATPQNDVTKAKYSDFLHLPHGLQGFFEYNEALAHAKKVGKPLFVDFTGHGCVNCREMEARVWSDPRVLKLLREEYVVVALYADDKKTLDKSEWVTLDNGKVLKELGKINSNFVMNKFGANAQPYYILLDGSENQLLEPRGYDLNPDAFVAFLEEGVKNYKK